MHIISAPAIGYGKRIFCIDFKDKEIKTFINPVIVSSKGLTLSREKSYYLPRKTYIRPRNTEIEVMYQTPLGQVNSRKLLGMAAIVFQQMIDDLNGLFLSDIGLEINKDFDDATEEEQMEIINMYADSLDLKLSSINDNIEHDDVARSYKNTIDFLTSVYKGETILANPDDEEENMYQHLQNILKMLELNLIKQLL